MQRGRKGWIKSIGRLKGGEFSEDRTEGKGGAKGEKKREGRKVREGRGGKRGGEGNHMWG